MSGRVRAGLEGVLGLKRAELPRAGMVAALTDRPPAYLRRTIPAPERPHGGPPLAAAPSIPGRGNQRSINALRTSLFRDDYQPPLGGGHNPPPNLTVEQKLAVNSNAPSKHYKIQVRRVRFV